MSRSSSGRASLSAFLDKADPHCPGRKPTSSLMRFVSSCGTASAKACESFLGRHPGNVPCPSSWARTWSCAGGQQVRDVAVDVPDVQSDQSKPWNSPAADVVLLQHDRLNGLVLVQRGLALAAALGVRG